MDTPAPLEESEAGLLLMGDNAAVDSSGGLRPAMWLFSDDQSQNRKSLHEPAARLQQRGDKVGSKALSSMPND